MLDFENEKYDIYSNIFIGYSCLVHVRVNIFGFDLNNLHTGVRGTAKRLPRAVQQRNFLVHHQAHPRCHRSLRQIRHPEESTYAHSTPGLPNLVETWRYYFVLFLPCSRPPPCSSKPPFRPYSPPSSRRSLPSRCHRLWSSSTLTASSPRRSRNWLHLQTNVGGSGGTEWTEGFNVHFT